jgi:hypothetical protein
MPVERLKPVACVNGGGLNEIQDDFRGRSSASRGWHGHGRRCACAAGEMTPNQPPTEVFTVSGVAQIIGPGECPRCGEDRGDPIFCFAGEITGDLSGTFQSALFGNPFFPPDDAPEVAILEVCSIIVLHQDERDAPIKRLNVQTLETEDRIFARSNPAASPLFFDAFGELLSVVGGDCGGLITLLGDALDGAPYVGRLICPVLPNGPPQCR